MPLSVIIALTILLGFLPPLLWLWFWLKEDAHPEPKFEIALVFSMGMSAVMVAFIFEAALAEVNKYFRLFFLYSIPAFNLINVIGFAVIEELAKLSAALMTALRSRYFDEPVDAMIYVITAALGFAALENILFVSQVATTNISETIMVSAFRFANAVLIHGTTGAIIGASFAFSFCHRNRRRAELFLALILAITLHAVYNFYILRGLENPQNQVLATITVAGGAVIALILFERAKRLHAICTV